jgi:hypothetical protein
LKPASANSSTRPYLDKPFTKLGLVEWLKMKALSSNPSIAKKEKKYFHIPIRLDKYQNTNSTRC